MLTEYPQFKITFKNKVYIVVVLFFFFFKTMKIHLVFETGSGDDKSTSRPVLG